MARNGSWREPYTAVLPKACPHCYSEWTASQQDELQGLDNTLVWEGGRRKEDYNRFEIDEMYQGIHRSEPSPRPEP